MIVKVFCNLSDSESMNSAVPFHKMLLKTAATHVILSSYLYANTFEKISICVHFVIMVFKKI